MENSKAFIIASLAATLVTIVIMIFCAYKQMFEVLLPKDWLTKYSWFIWLIQIIAILGTIPVAAYLTIRLQGHESLVLRNLSSICGRLAGLAMASLWLPFYVHRIRNKR